MSWHDFLPYLIFGVTFLATVLSGMTGGGGGFIITPFLIAIGLTPQQSIATGKLGALGLDTGAIAAFRGKIKQYKNFTFFLTIIAIIAGFISSYFIRNAKNENLQLVMGILNLTMAPFLLVKHHRLKSRRSNYLLRALSVLIIGVVFLLQGTFSSGVGSLVSVFLVLLFGFKVLEANLIKRQTSVALDVVVLACLLGTGLINYEYGLIAAAAGLAGGYIGSKFALHEGEKFARYALLVLMIVSGIWLIVTA